MINRMTRFAASGALCLGLLLAPLAAFATNAEPPAPPLYEQAGEAGTQTQPQAGAGDSTTRTGENETVPENDSITGAVETTSAPGIGTEKSSSGSTPPDAVATAGGASTSEAEATPAAAGAEANALPATPAEEPLAAPPTDPTSLGAVSDYAGLAAFFAAANSATSGTLEISGDIEIPADATHPVFTLPAGANITLLATSACTIYGAPRTVSASLTMFSVEQGASLTLGEAAGATLTLNAENLYGPTAGYTRRGIVYTAGSFTLQGGALTGFRSSSNQMGAVVVHGPAAEFYMEGGSIENNSIRFQDSAPVLLLNGAYMELSGGKIANNTSPGYNYSAAGVLLYAQSNNAALAAPSTLLMSGGSITGNKGYTGGVGLFMPENDYGYSAANMHRLTMTGGDITGNTGLHGGGVFVYNAGAFVLDGGTIQNNKGAMGGGVAVFAGYDQALGAGYTGTPADWDGYRPSSFTMRSGSITGNRAVDDETHNGIQNYGGVGGGVYAASWRVNLLGGSISGNTATLDGGGAVLIDARVEMENTTLTGNTADGRGGGIYVGVRSELHVNAGVTPTSITQNQSATHGGGVYNAATARLHSALVQGNTAAQDGGGIYTEDYEALETDNLHFAENVAGNGCYLFDFEEHAALADTHTANVRATAALTLPHHTGHEAADMRFAYNNNDINYAGITPVADPPPVGGEESSDPSGTTASAPTGASGNASGGITASGGTNYTGSNGSSGRTSGSAIARTGHAAPPLGALAAMGFAAALALAGFVLARRRAQ